MGPQGGEGRGSDSGSSEQWITIYARHECESKPRLGYSNKGQEQWLDFARLEASDRHASLRLSGTIMWIGRENGKRRASCNTEGRGGAEKGRYM